MTIRHTSHVVLCVMQVSGSVRCLVWLREGCVLVGTLDGCLYWCTVGESEPKLLLQQQGSIIHMRLDQNREVLCVHM